MAIANSTGLHVVAVALAIGGCSVLMASTDNTQDPLFSAAEAYERFMGRWSRQMAPLLVRFAGVRGGDRVLDVGSGTGALAGAVGDVAPTVRVVGIDPADPYVAFAKARNPQDRFAFEVGDARKMRFGDASFDRSLSLLVVNFIPDAGKAVGEMKRVTRKDGTVAAAVWDYGDGMEMLRVFWDAVVALRPEDDKKDERHMPYCGRGELAGLWKQQGFQQVTEDALIIETRFASFDDYWQPFTEKQGPAGAYVAALSPEQRDALKQRLRSRLLANGPDRAITMSARAWAVRGIVP